MNLAIQDREELVVAVGHSPGARQNSGAMAWIGVSPLLKAVQKKIKNFVQPQLKREKPGMRWQDPTFVGYLDFEFSRATLRSQYRKKD